MDFILFRRVRETRGTKPTPHQSSLYFIVFSLVLSGHLFLNIKDKLAGRGWGTVFKI